MIRVNLRAPERSARGRPAHARRAAMRSVAAVLCGAGLVGIWWGAIRRDIVRADARIAASERDLGRWQNTAAIAERAAARAQALSARLALVSRLRGGRRGPAALLAAIGRSTSGDVRLTEVTQRGGQTRIEGRAASLAALDDFADRLRRAAGLDPPLDILNVTAETGRGASVVLFAIGATAPPPASGASSRTPEGTGK